MKLTESNAPMAEIELDKKRNLVFDYEAMIQIEEALPGESTFNPDFWAKITAKKMRVILWAGLLYEDPTLSIDQVKAFIKGKNPAEITQKIMVAWGLSKPEPKEDDEPADPPTPETSNQVGSTSGQ
jgi:hypothetical protein